METKCCTKCNEVKPVIEFNKHKRNKNGLQSRCKFCKKEEVKVYYSTDKGKLSHKTTQKKYINKKQGIYEWTDGEKCLYIGQSKQLIGRIIFHKTYFKNPEKNLRHKELYVALNKHPNAFIRVIEECSQEVLLEREQHYIDTLKPLYNEYKS